MQYLILITRKIHVGVFEDATVEVETELFTVFSDSFKDLKMATQAKFKPNENTTVQILLIDDIYALPKLHLHKEIITVYSLEG